jgi:hypothetical protein
MADDIVCETVADSKSTDEKTTTLPSPTQSTQTVSTPLALLMAVSFMKTVKQHDDFSSSATCD